MLGNTSSGCISSPAWLAANMQSLRKYMEHVGLTGSTVNSSTRSIVAEGWVATFVNFTLLHEPYHGVHHWHSGLPHPNCLSTRPILEPRPEEERPPFRTFGAAALRDLFDAIWPTRGSAPSGSGWRQPATREHWPSEDRTDDDPEWRFRLGV